VESVRKQLCVLIAGLAMVGLSVAAGVRVCAKCGHEPAAQDRKCGHCGSVLPEAETAGEDTAPATESRRHAAKACFSAETIEVEIKMARKALSDGDADLAECFLRNASALNQLAESASAAKNGDNILELLERCGTGRGGVSVNCPVCEGTGKVAPRRLSEKSAMPSLVGPCRHCSGKGRVQRARRLSEIRLAKGRALKKYRRIQQNRRFQPVGEAWAPPDSAEDLSVDQRVALKRTMASPCKDCGGLGEIECDECSGTGRIKCSNRKCVDGMVSSRRSDHLGKGKHLWRSKCHVCEGKGWLSCVDCGARGAVLCRECGGSGERDLCRRCSGEGVVACRRCRGSGSYKGSPCTYCGGEGMVECKSCNGDGRGR